jgi:hypothetical protein
MAQDPTYVFPLKPDSYAAFDAISLRNLIIDRLNEQGIFTDQNFVGSNLAAIIDIISFSYNTLIYYLNKTSTESMFTEAQLYENISRIVRLLDYKPVGYQTSTVAFQCSAENTFERGVYTIPRYSYISIGTIPFSFVEDVTFSIPTDYTTTILQDLANKKLLYQGVFRENPIHVAAGDKNEVVTINTKNALIDHFTIDVYVLETDKSDTDSRGTKKWFKYTNIPNLHTENSTARVFEKRLNSTASYEIMFGDGINGRSLNEGEQVIIYFLQSNGEAGVIGTGALKQSKSYSLYNTQNFLDVLENTNNEQFNYIDKEQFAQLRFNNTTGSTLTKNIEDAESIRVNAPLNFKSQYRLITARDYETFVKTNFANFISDIRVFSNWEYTGKYMKYFHDIGINPGGFQQIILNQVQYADSCNFNNIYICGVPKISEGSMLKYLLPAQKELIKSHIEPLKVITTETSFLDPIYKAVGLGAKLNNDVIVSETNTYVLEITKSSTSARSNQSILKEIASVFTNMFNPTNVKLGQSVEYTKLVNQIMSVSGVHKIRTRNLNFTNSYEGLSLFLWNPVYPELDKKVVTNDTSVEDFQLLYFDDLSTIDTRIVIV